MYWMCRWRLCVTGFAADCSNPRVAPVRWLGLIFSNSWWEGGWCDSLHLGFPSAKSMPNFQFSPRAVLPKPQAWQNGSSLMAVA